MHTMKLKATSANANADADPERAKSMVPFSSPSARLMQEREPRTGQ